MQISQKRSQHVRTKMVSTNVIGSPLTVPYLMCTLTFLSLLTASTFIFSYMVYKKPAERTGLRGLLSSLVGRAGSNGTQHACQETYCKAAARYYSRHVALPLNMCEQLTSPICNTTRTVRGNNSSLFRRTVAQQTKIYFETLDINAMAAEPYFPVVQLREFLDVCVRSTKKNGVHDFVMLMENFGLKQWPIAPDRVDLTNLIASVARELGQQPLFALSIAGNADPGAPIISLYLDKPQLLLKKTIPTSAAPILFTMTKYLEECCERFGVCLKHGEAEHVVSTIVKFEELLYSYMHPFSKPIKMKLKEMNNNKVVEAAKSTVEVLKGFATRTPWFKKEDTDIVHEKLNRLEVSALVPDIARIRRFVQEYYNNIPAYNKDVGFLQNFYIMKKFVTSKAWSISKSPESRQYRWPLSSFRRKCFYDMQENRLYIPAIHMLMVQNTTGRIEFPQIPIIAYHVLHALIPLLFRAGSIYNQYGNYKEWWTVETEESFSRAQSCLVEQYFNSMHSSSNMLHRESESLALHILSQNFLIEPAYKLYTSRLDSAGYDQTNFSLHESFPADSKEVFYIAHMLTTCKETNAARSTVLYSDDLYELYRYNIPFYNFKPYRELAMACDIKHLSILSQIKFCKIWD